MRILFDMDTKDYNENGKVFSRPSARAIIIRDEKVLLIYSKKYDYYKFPGGGIETGEEPAEALVREVQEETGYRVIPDTISEYGIVPRRHRDIFDPDCIFQQDNLYYLCDVDDIQGETKLDGYELEEGFTAMWKDPFEAFNSNRYSGGAAAGKDIEVIQRDTRVLEMVYYMILDRIHVQKEHDLIERLGNPAYFDMCEFVKESLRTEETEDIGAKSRIHYSRYEHSLHVIAWAKRLYDIAVTDPDTAKQLKYDELMIATIFHDVGRCVSDGTPHAHAGTPIVRDYLLKHGYPEEKTEYICMLVNDHSDKWRMRDADIDRNLLMLMEADLLDDMGALGIVMDCMITEKRKPDAGFYDCYNHIKRYTLRQQQNNPMVTPEGIALWDEKTKLAEAFTKALEADIAYC